MNSIPKFGVANASGSSRPTDFQEVKGVPPGLTAYPIAQPTEKVRGVPPGLTAFPISQSKPSSQASQPTAEYAPKVQGVPAGLTPQPIDIPKKIHDATISEGQSEERAQLRVNRYNKAVGQRVNPQRAEEFAMSLRWPDAPKQTLTDEQQKNIYQYALQQAQDFKSGKQKTLESHTLGESWVPPVFSDENSYRQHIDPEEYARSYVKGYTYAKAQGWEEGRAQQYAASDAAARLESRLGAWAEPIWKSSAGWVADKLGIHHPYERVVNPWMGTNEETEADEFKKYQELSWADNVAQKSKWKGYLAKGVVGLDTGGSEFLGNLLSAQNVLLMVASEGTSVLGSTGLETPIALQKTIRTTSKLANAGFMYQMASGSVEDFKRTAEAYSKGDVAEFIEALISGAGNVWMVKHGVDHARAEAAVRERLNAKTGEIFSGKKFGDLKTQDQAIVLDRLANEDPMFQQSDDVSDKQAEKNLKRIKYRYGIAVQEAWNPSAAERAIRKLHTDRAEAAAKEREATAREHETAVEESIRKAAEEDKKTEAVKRDKIISDNESAKQKNLKAREDRENEAPRPQATEVIPRAVVDGEEVYGPVSRLEQEAYIGVEPVNNGFGVFVQDKDGKNKQYLNLAGFFGQEEAATSVDDEESAKTLAKIQALRTTTAGDAAKDDHLGNVTQQLIDKDIDYRRAQDLTGVGGDERIPDEHDAASGEGVEGPFVKGRAEFLSDFDKGYEKTGQPEEKKAAYLAQAEASAWNLTNENLNMLTRSGDQIVDRDGEAWTLGADGLLHGANGKEIPLTKDGLYTNQVMNMAAHGRVRYGRQSYEEAIKEPSDFGYKLKAALGKPVASRTPPISADTAVNAVAEQVAKSAGSSASDPLENAIYEYAIPRNMDPHTLAGDISGKAPSRRTPEERAFLTNYLNWDKREEIPPNESYEPIWVDNNQLAAQEVKDRAGMSAPEPRNEEEAKENVDATEGRQESTISEVVRTTAEIGDVNAGTTEQEIDKRAQVAKEATDTLHLAVQQSADAAGKAARKGDYPRGGGIPIISRGNRTEISKGTKSHPVQYALVDVEAPIVSHNWRGKNLEPNEDYVPKEMQYRDFDENRTAEVFGEAQPENFRSRFYLDLTVSPSEGPAILDSYGRVVGGNTRLLRLKKWLENISRITDDVAKETEISLFRNAVKTYCAAVEIDKIPDDGRTYVPVRILDKPIETIGEAAELGRLFNDRSSAQVSENIEALSNGKLLSEADAQERLNKEPGILSQIGEKLAGNDVSTVRAGIDNYPEWFAKVARDYFHIPPTENAAWFDGVGEDATLSNAGKDKFVLALIGSHIQDAEAVRQLRNTDAESSLARAIGTVTALRAYPDRDLTDKVTEAVSAAAKTRRLRREGEKPIPAWNHVYGNGDLYLGKPAEPSRISQAIYLALLDSKTSRLNAALRDMIGRLGKLGEGQLFDVGTAADRFNDAFHSELEKIAKSQEKTLEPVTFAEFESALQNREWIPREEEIKEEAQEEKPEVEAKPEPTPKFGPPPETTSPAVMAERKIDAAKAANGRITAKDMKEFVEDHPNLKGHASEIMNALRIFARSFWDREKPADFKREHALDWALQKADFRGLANDKSDEVHRGAYDLATHILTMFKAGDVSTFVHEVAHGLSPLLNEDDWKAIDTIEVDKRQWKKAMGREWNFTGDNERMEKLAYGLERIVRDENPIDFKANVEARKVLKELKKVFIEIYKAFTHDPLSALKLGPDAKKWFFDRFGIEGINKADEFQTEIEAAEKAKKRMKKPSEVLDPIQELAKDIGASGKPEKFVSGPIEDSVGEPIRITNSVAFAFDTLGGAERAISILANEIDTGRKRTDGADMVRTRDGKYAIRMNVEGSAKRPTLYQELPPESHGELGVRWKQLRKELAALPRNKILDKQFLQMQIDDLENRIRAEYGLEEREPKNDPELARQVMEEKKNERANRAREGVHEAAGIQRPPTVDRLSGKAELGVSRYGGAGGSASIRGLGLDGVPVISMPPLRATDDPVVGKTAEDAPETEESWKKRTGEAGMSTESPLPIWALSQRTARILDEDQHPGQAPTVQIVMSSLQRGDGALVANGTGSGKTWVAMGIVSEFGRDREAGEKPLTLYITRNRPLLEKTADEPAKSFGVELSLDTPNFGVKNGTYGVSYQAALRNPVYQNIKWDLVIADEAGEARNWFKKADNKKGMSQGQMLMAIMQNAKKGVYMSATPFHTPLEVGYLEKLGLWPKGGYEDWLKRNWKTYYKDKTLVAELDPAKMARLRKQLIQRGQMVSQTLSYEGFNVHFGFVPMTNAMKRGLDTISGLMERARTRTKLTDGISPKSISAYEAQFTKAFVEREKLPQAIDITKKALEQGYSVIIASPSTDEDLFRRERDGEPTPFQQMDDSMNGQFSRLLPRLPNVFDALQAEFGDRIGNYSGVNQSDTGREKVRKEFQDGTRDLAYMSIPAGGIGSDWHDTKGDKPRLMVVLGPPYSGVLLEQTLGRSWRDGTKSDVHVIFLGSDAAPEVRVIKELVAPRVRSIQAAVHGIKDSLATAMENYSDVEKTRAEQDTMNFAIGNEIEVKAADYGVRHSGRVVGIDSWDAIQIPPASEAMNKGLRTGENAGRSWTDLYQDKEKAFNPPPKNLKAEKAINDIAEAAAKNPDIPEESIALGAAHASEVADMAPEGIDPAEAGKYAMKAALEGNGFTYNPDTGKWEAPFEIVEKMLGRDTSDIDERRPDYSAKPGITDRIKEKIRVPAINLARKIGLQKEVRNWFDEKSGLYPKLTVGMNFEQRALSAARRIGAEAQVRRVFGLNYSYDQAKEKYAGPSQMRLLEIFTNNGLNPNPKSFAEKSGILGKPGRDDVRAVIDVVEGRAASDDPRINKAAEELRQWFADWRVLMAEKKVHLDGGGTFADIPKNPKYVNHITDWDMELTDPQTGEIRSLSEITDDKTLDDVAKLRYFEKTRQELGAGSETMRGWLNQLNEDRKAHLKRPKNPNITRKRTINHPFYHKDIWSLMSYSDQAASALALEETYGHDMSRLGSALADVPSRQLRKALKKDVDLAFERQDWSTTMGKIVRAGQGFEAITKMALSPFSVMMHNIHAGLNLGIKPWATAQLRMMAHPHERMREKYYAGVVMIKMNPALLEGPRRGIAGKYFDWSGFSAVYRWQRAAVAETAWAWMEQDALSDLRAGGKRAETSRRLLKDRLLLSDDEINNAVANNRWDDESKWKAERVFADKVAFSERSSQMPRMARLSMAEDLDDTEKNAHAALRGAYMLESFQIKSYSGMKEWLFDEVFHQRNFRPLLPFFLLYPAAGFALLNVKAAAVGGVHRAFEKATGQEHEHDRWDDLLEDYKDVEKHPWVGPLKLFLESFALGMANERMKRWVDIGMMAAMGQKKKLENRLQYFAVDELDQLVGGLYSDIFVAGVVTPSKSLYDYIRTKNPLKKMRAAGKDFAKEAKNLAWPLGTIPKVNEWAGTKKFTPPPK